MNRQDQGEAGASTWAIFGTDLTTMANHDVMANGQSKPCSPACRLGGHKRLKQSWHQLARDAVALITDTQFNMAFIVLTQPDTDIAPQGMA